MSFYKGEWLAHILANQVMKVLGVHTIGDQQITDAELSRLLRGTIRREGCPSLLNEVSSIYAAIIYSKTPTN